MPAILLTRSPLLTAALLATAAAFSPGGRAAAQPGASLPPLKMFQPLRSPPAPAASRPTTVNHGPAPATAPAPVQVALSFPGTPDAAFVAIRGPDGELRYFPVEGGKKELATRVIVVRPGERVHIQLPPPKAR
jgi:hypothetical protein